MMRSLAVLLLLTPNIAPAQQTRALTEANYARAVRMLTQYTTPLVTGGQVRATWLPDGRFWYRNTTVDSSEIVVFDPIKRARTRVAAPPTSGPQARRNEVLSPDGKHAVFIRDHNLWVRDVTSGRERQLTQDGVKDYGYATNNAGWIRSDRPVVTWSPDSRKVATFQHDGRRVGEMYLVTTNVGHPELDAWKYPLPGDSAIFMIERVIVDVENARVTRLQMPPDAHRSTVCDHVTCDGDFEDVQWSVDGSQLAFVSSSRDHKHALLRVADVATGAVRDVLEERVATQYESGYDKNNWYVLFDANEVIWFSERDDWGHLYLYDLRNGRLKHQITRGAWPVWQVLHVNERARAIYFLAGGREPGRDPYFGHLYRVDLNGRNLRLLTPENANHSVEFSPDGKYILDSYSTPVVPAVTVLRDLNGNVLTTLERADVSRLLATGWTPPIPFTVKARDGKTDLYGLMHRPSSFDSTKSYPIINYIYPGPQGGSVGSRRFQPSRGDTRALAELGFIVFQLDGMGNPQRSKSFHDAYYGNMGDNTLPDQVTGMQQLAQRHRWIDIDRAGIYGHSGGGFAAAGAILRYPDFFKVAVSQAGNHDNRNYEDDWGERYQGLLRRNANGTTNYDDQANQTHARNLKGKLLLAHGSLDDNVPYYSTLLLVNELIRHNKDFDLLIMPNRRHGFGNEAYMMRRRWDYFVRHLLGAEPPKEFEIVLPANR